MSPNATVTELLTEEDLLKPVTKAAPWQYQVVYRNVLIILYYHLAGCFGLYIAVTRAKWPTLALAFTNFFLATMGFTAGAHRLWSHRSYKARWPLQVFLMLCHTIAGQNSLVYWSRVHRMHHKYSDTDADPHNVSRGFFFSHVGWLLVKKHPQVKLREKGIDMADLKSNPILMFQHRMSPNATVRDLVTDEDLLKPVTKAAPWQYQIVYKNVLLFLYYHLAGCFGLYVAVTRAKWPTLALAFTNFFLSTIGVTAGAHRLWSHRSYKARWPLQVFLMLCHTVASQNSLVHWGRDHRLHHKYSDTDADPHNVNRGFFFSHVGWLLVKKHPEVKLRGKGIDVSDLTSNPILMFQHRNSFWFITLIAFVLPTFIPSYFWGETVLNAWHVNLFRYMINLNMAFMINSFSHLYGYRPYEKGICPAQNKALFYMTMGEGSHNYHHVFPWDYRTDGLGLFNIVTRFIDGCAALGLVYDRKVADEEMIKARAERTGDGSAY